MAYAPFEAIVVAQVSRSAWRDIQQLDGLNLQGTRKVIYLNGEIDGVRRGRGDTVLHGDLAGDAAKSI
jgi:hypothetical protein